MITIEDIVEYLSTTTYDNVEAVIYLAEVELTRRESEWEGE